jgi:hypothetical protein
LGDEKLYFVGLSLNNGGNLTFAAMRAIYEAHGGPSFVVESFKPDPGDELNRIQMTMLSSTANAVKVMLTD